MSRIHEALKKAEEERAASQPATDASPRLQSDVLAPSVQTGETAGVSGSLPQFVSPFSFDTLLARCIRTNWTPDARTMLFFGADEQSDGTEEFRTLRSRLYQMRERQSLKKILVTSAVPKEGKTFVAANLTQVMVRQHGRRALLIDADLRNPSLHTVLGTQSAPGLSEYLLGETDEFGAIHCGPMENLFFVPAGRLVSNPAELAANGRLKFLLNRVEALFDWIIIDSPPAVPVSDASLLANFCDGVLMVVRSGVTPFDTAKKARQEFVAEQLIGVVLNGIDPTTLPYSPYYYSAYGVQRRVSEQS